MQVRWSGTVVATWLRLHDAPIVRLGRCDEVDPLIAARLADDHGRRATIDFE